MSPEDVIEALGICQQNNVFEFDGHLYRQVKQHETGLKQAMSGSWETSWQFLEWENCPSSGGIITTIIWVSSLVTKHTVRKLSVSWIPSTLVRVSWGREGQLTLSSAWMQRFMAMLHGNFQSSRRWRSKRIVAVAMHKYSLSNLYCWNIATMIVYSKYIFIGILLLGTEYCKALLSPLFFSFLLDI